MTGRIPFLLALLSPAIYGADASSPAATPIQQGFAKDAFSYLLTLRLITLFPFFAVNLVSGLTRMNVGAYVVATAIGIIPGSFVYAYAGRQLGTINSLKDIVSPGVIGAFVLLGLLALAPNLYKKWSGKPA